MVLFPLKTWTRLIHVVVLTQNQKASVTSIVYFVFIYKWQLFYYQIQKLFEDLRRLLKFLIQMLCNAWLTLVNHLHFKIYPYTYIPILCICLGFFLCTEKSWKIQMHQLCVFCWSEIKYLSYLAYGMKYFSLPVFHSFGIIIIHRYASTSTNLKSPLMPLHSSPSVVLKHSESASDLMTLVYLSANQNMWCLMDGSWWKLSFPFWLDMLTVTVYSNCSLNTSFTKRCVATRTLVFLQATKHVKIEARW